MTFGKKVSSTQSRPTVFGGHLKFCPMSAEDPTSGQRLSRLHISEEWGSYTYRLGHIHPSLHIGRKGSIWNFNQGVKSSTYKATWTFYSNKDNIYVVIILNCIKNTRKKSFFKVLHLNILWISFQRQYLWKSQYKASTVSREKSCQIEENCRKFSYRVLSISAISKIV